MIRHWGKLFDISVQFLFLLNNRGIGFDSISPRGLRWVHRCLLFSISDHLPFLFRYGALISPEWSIDRSWPHLKGVSDRADCRLLLFYWKSWRLEGNTFSPAPGVPEIRHYSLCFIHCLSIFCLWNSRMNASFLFSLGFPPSQRLSSSSRGPLSKSHCVFLSYYLLSILVLKLPVKQMNNVLLLSRWSSEFPHSFAAGEIANGRRDAIEIYHYN